jgi:threonine/homoserine/homoserine lactone efflux protein
MTDLLSQLLPTGPSLPVFLVASLVLALTPGPAVFFVVTRTLTEGRRAGLAAVAGVALGNLGNALAAALGLAALFAASATLFTLVRWIGAIYLVWIGIEIIRTSAPATTPAPRGKAFRDGLIVALFNPKTTLFFAAFLPQFVERGERAAIQTVALGALFVLIATATDALYALGASSLAPALTRAPAAHNIARVLTGSAFIGLGLVAAFARFVQP